MFNSARTKKLTNLASTTDQEFTFNSLMGLYVCTRDSAS